MPAGQDDDETRALLDELQEALGGEPDMTAASGLGPRDRGNEDDVIAGSGRGSGGSGGSSGGGGNRPPAATTTRTSSSAPGAGSRDTGPGGAGGGGARTNVGALLAALLIGLLVGGGLAALVVNKDEGGGDDFAGKIDTSRYQSVILTNDKVYFGQLKTVSATYYELDNAFFLRETRESADAEPVRALLPVNREIHAPENTMLIRKAEVVLVENLAKDSPILTEIKRQKG
jgi:hypothetical protein